MPARNPRRPAPFGSAGQSTRWRLTERVVATVQAFGPGKGDYALWRPRVMDEVAASEPSVITPEMIAAEAERVLVMAGGEY